MLHHNTHTHTHIKNKMTWRTNIEPMKQVSHKQMFSFVSSFNLVDCSNRSVLRRYFHCFVVCTYIFFVFHVASSAFPFFFVSINYKFSVRESEISKKCSHPFNGSFCTYCISVYIHSFLFEFWQNKSEGEEKRKKQGTKNYVKAHRKTVWFYLLFVVAFIFFLLFRVFFSSVYLFASFFRLVFFLFVCVWSLWM